MPSLLSFLSGLEQWTTAAGPGQERHGVEPAALPAGHAQSSHPVHCPLAALVPSVVNWWVPPISLWAHPLGTETRLVGRSQSQRAEQIAQMDVFKARCDYDIPLCLKCQPWPSFFFSPKLVATWLFWCGNLTDWRVPAPDGQGARDGTSPADCRCLSQPKLTLIFWPGPLLWSSQGEH